MGLWTEPLSGFSVELEKISKCVYTLETPLHDTDHTHKCTIRWHISIKSRLETFCGSTLFQNPFVIVIVFFFKFSLFYNNNTLQL